MDRLGTGKYYHEAVAHNGTLYLSGVVANDFSLGMKEQTIQALQRAEALLDKHGSNVERVLTATVYISDFAAKEEMNEAWVEFFAADQLPTRATVGVADLGAGVLIEIVLTAAL